MAGVLYIRDPVTGEFVPVPTLVGPPGPGVPAGGAAGQVLVKSGEADLETQWRTLTADDVSALAVGGTAADSSKLGGKAPEYYTLMRNELDNSDFTRFIAQAGIGGNHGTQAYAGDRWMLVSGTVTGSANANGDGYSGIVLNGTIRQIPASPPAVATVAVGMISGSAQITYADGSVEITSDGGTLKWAALYEGSYTAENLPPYVPKGYAAELMECMRYFQPIMIGGRDETWLARRIVGTDHVQVPMKLSIPMREIPSLITPKAFPRVVCYGEAGQIAGVVYATNLDLYGQTNQTVTLQVYVTLPDGTDYRAYGGIEVDAAGLWGVGDVFLSADL